MALRSIFVTTACEAIALSRTHSFWKRRTE